MKYTFITLICNAASLHGMGKTNSNILLSGLSQLTGHLNKEALAHVMTLASKAAGELSALSFTAPVLRLIADLSFDLRVSVHQLEATQPMDQLKEHLGLKQQQQQSALSGLLPVLASYTDMVVIPSLEQLAAATQQLYGRQQGLLQQPDVPNEQLRTAVCERIDQQHIVHDAAAHVREMLRLWQLVLVELPVSHSASHHKKSAVHLAAASVGMLSRCLDTDLVQTDSNTSTSNNSSSVSSLNQSYESQNNGTARSISKSRKRKHKRKYLTKNSSSSSSSSSSEAFCRDSSSNRDQTGMKSKGSKQSSNNSGSNSSSLLSGSKCSTPVYSETTINLGNDMLAGQDRFMRVLSLTTRDVMEVSKVILMMASGIVVPDTQDGSLQQQSQYQQVAHGPAMLRLDRGGKQSQLQLSDESLELLLATLAYQTGALLASAGKQQIQEMAEVAAAKSAQQQDEDDASEQQQQQPTEESRTMPGIFSSHKALLQHSLRVPAVLELDIQASDFETTVCHTLVMLLLQITQQLVVQHETSGGSSSESVTNHLPGQPLPQHSSSLDSSISNSQSAKAKGFPKQLIPIIVKVLVQLLMLFGYHHGCVDYFHTCTTIIELMVMLLRTTAAENDSGSGCHIRSSVGCAQGAAAVAPDPESACLSTLPVLPAAVAAGLLHPVVQLMPEYVLGALDGNTQSQEWQRKQQQQQEGSATSSAPTHPASDKQRMLRLYGWLLTIVCQSVEPKHIAAALRPDPVMPLVAIEAVIRCQVLSSAALVNSGKPSRLRTTDLQEDIAEYRNQQLAEQAQAMAALSVATSDSSSLLAPPAALASTLLGGVGVLDTSSLLPFATKMIQAAGHLLRDPLVQQQILGVKQAGSNSASESPTHVIVRAMTLTITACKVGVSVAQQHMQQQQQQQSTTLRESSGNHDTSASQIAASTSIATAQSELADILQWCNTFTHAVCQVALAVNHVMCRSYSCGEQSCNSSDSSSSSSSSSSSALNLDTVAYNRDGDDEKISGSRGSMLSRLPLVALFKALNALVQVHQSILRLCLPERFDTLQDKNGSAHWVCSLVVDKAAGRRYFGEDTAVPVSLEILHAALNALQGISDMLPSADSKTAQPIQQLALGGKAYNLFAEPDSLQHQLPRLQHMGCKIAAMLERISRSAVHCASHQCKHPIVSCGFSHGDEDGATATTRVAGDHNISPNSASAAHGDTATDQLHSLTKKKVWGANMYADLLQISAYEALARMPVPFCCNNPSCVNLSKLSEYKLVSGKACVCGGCKMARYCSGECQKQHWKLHKPVCRQITG